jgi:hypothetical protein
MESEAKIIIAFLFNRSGKTLLKDSELYLPLSMELGWLSTKESQEFVKYAVTQGLLVKKEELLQPNFPLEKIVIPLGFTPSKRLFSEKTEEQPGNLIDASFAGKSNKREKKKIFSLRSQHSLSEKNTGSTSQRGMRRSNGSFSNKIKDDRKQQDSHAMASPYTPTDREEPDAGCYE